MHPITHLLLNIILPTSITKALIAIVTRTVVWGAVIVMICTTSTLTCSHSITRHVFHHVPYGTVLRTANFSASPVRGAWFCTKAPVTLVTCAVIGALTNIIGMTTHTPNCNGKFCGYIY